MAYDLELPSWIVEQPLREAQVGQALGRNILEGLRFQQNRMMYEQEAPMRDAQLAATMAQTQAQVLNNESKALAMGLETNARAGMKDALALEADIASRSGGWLDPETPIRVNQLISQYPGLNNTTWHKRIIDSVNTAKEKDFETKQLEQQYKQQQTLAEIREAGDIAAVLARPRDVDDPTAAMKNTEATIQAEIAAGDYTAGSPEEAARRRELMRRGGKGELRPEGSIFQKLNASDVFVTRGNTWAQKLEQFEKDFGANKLQQFIGPVDVPIQKVIDNLRRRTDPASQAALDLFQEYQGIFNASALITSGQNVTANELLRKEKEIGTTVNQNFSRMFKNYLNQERENFKKSLINYKSAGYSLPRSFDYTVGLDDEQPQPQPAGPRRFKTISVKQIQ